MLPTVSENRSRDPASLYPVALLAGCFSCGILVEHFAPIPGFVSLLSGAGFAALALLFLSRDKLSLSTLMVCISFACAGAALAHADLPKLDPSTVRGLYESNVIAAGDPVEITGSVDGEPELAPDALIITLRTEKLRSGDTVRNVSGNVELFAFLRDANARAAYDALALHYGARVAVMTGLSRAESYRNPGGSLRSDYLDDRRLDATGSIKSTLLIERLDDERVFLPLALLYEWRQRLLKEINNRFPPETAGVLDAALLGNRNYLSHSAAERFRDGGTFHILVINGLHIGFIAWLLWLLAKRVTRNRLAQFLITVIFLWAYAFAIGAATPVTRAALMFTFSALAPVLFRRATAVNVLGCAAFGLLIIRPGELFDPAFQLTIFSVLSIVTIAAPFIHKLKEVGEWRISRETPYPPTCARWLRSLAESLFWSEKAWRKEMERSTYSYRLFKTPVATRLESMHVQRVLRYAFEAVVISAGVQIGLVPLLVLYFHRVSVASLLLNVYVGILMASLALIALLGIAIAEISVTAAKPLVFIADRLNSLIVHSVDPFASMHISSIRVPQYTGLSWSIYVIYYLLLAGVVISLARWKPIGPPASKASEPWAKWPRSLEWARWLPWESASGSFLNAGAFVVALVIILAHPFSAPRGDGRLHIDQLDVGQGDSALLTMPDGVTLLIDGGGRPTFGQARSATGDFSTPRFQRDTRSVGEAVVAEYLWWKGLDHVDYILATHADADHIDGLNYIASNFAVRSAIVARTPSRDAEYVRFAETAGNNRLPVTVVGRGDVLGFGGVTVEILWPSHLPNPDAPYRNNDSLVLKLRYGDRAFIFAGDIQKESETAIVGMKRDLSADVVKVAHHGSKTSSIDAFVSATHPKFALISVGLVSPFGHPAREVVERWTEGGARVLTTGKSGTISISTDGKDLRVGTFVREPG